MKRRIAALTAALVTFPAVAFAEPPESVTGHWAPPPLVVSDSADVASHLPALGTDVAASDQRASSPPRLTCPPGHPSRPRPATSKPCPADRDDFDWGDAGVGALAGTALAAFAMAGAVGLRRRPPTPLAG